MVFCMLKAVLDGSQHTALYRPLATSFLGADMVPLSAPCSSRCFLLGSPPFSHVWPDYDRCVLAQVSGAISCDLRSVFPSRSCAQVGY
jgi:hypothetical protein